MHKATQTDLNQVNNNSRIKMLPILLIMLKPVREPIPNCVTYQTNPLEILTHLPRY